MTVSLRALKKFRAVVLDYYKNHGRHTLPWRQTTDPYHILVSEVMLQQTQVNRVISKYELFIQEFPTTTALAKAPLATVLTHWQGLGYNRRAKLLQQAAIIIESQLAGHFPVTYEQLQALPGVGLYTAGAIMAFAYDKPVPIIETNIRTVFLHHFFVDKQGVSDAAILPLVAKSLTLTSPRLWYAALMDYGSYLKQTYGNNAYQSAHYQRQSRFVGSNRYARGYIIKVLTTTKEGLTVAKLQQSAPEAITDIQLREQLHALQKEEMIELVGRRYRLSTTLSQ